jgi:hypothetical protein
MATNPEAEDRQPTRAQRVARAAAAPSNRLPVLIALAASLLTLAPEPASAVGAACAVLVAWEVARKR